MHPQGTQQFVNIFSHITRKWALISMRGLMCHQDTLLCERLPTQVTWKWTLTTMNAQMPLQDCLIIKGFLTHLTWKWVLPYMSAKMSSNHVSEQKTFNTHHKKMDALHYECTYVPSYFSGIWKISYIYYMRKEVHEFWDALSCTAGVWKISYKRHMKMAARHCECVGVSAD